jgi:predicted PurR-regulated permease PerM
MAKAAPTERPTRTITRDDLESKLREVYSGVGDEVASTKNTMVTVAAVVGVIILIITFLLGVRGGKKKTTIVEIRRV